MMELMKSLIGSYSLLWGAKDLAAPALSTRGICVTRGFISIKTESRKATIRAGAGFRQIALLEKAGNW